MLSLLILASSLALAGDDNCTQITSYKDFYRCSLKQHPLSEAAKLKAQEGDAYLEQAAQWKNPDLELKTVGGSRAGENVGSTELTVSVPLSQLWTRDAKTDLAKAEQRKSEIEAQDTVLSVKKELIRDLYRLRQIDEEIALAEETLKTFGTIQSQFRGRRARGPEQEITLNLVELATSDYELKKNHLATEKLEIMSRLKGVWGPRFEMKAQYLPPAKDKWPAISSTAKTQHSLEVQKVLAEADKAIAEEKVVQRESWPEVSVGPAIERTTEGPSQFYSYGITLSMNLPLLTWNGGSRKLADARARQARFLADYTEKKSDLENQIHLQKYNSAIESMKKSFRPEELKKRHEKVDNLFRQGLASGAIVIEAHRQLSEYTASQHEHEIAAIESFMEIKTLRGEDIEEILQ